MKEALYRYNGDHTLEVAKKTKEALCYLEGANEHLVHAQMIGDVCIITIVTELLFFIRTNTTSTLTVTLTVERNDIEAHIVASGAGAGLLNVSWGSYAKIIRLADKALSELGFHAVSEEIEHSKSNSWLD